MNARTALCMALLEGRVLNVGNCFRQVGYSNIAREIPRLIEDPFGVEVSRVPKSGKNRYGSSIYFVNYRLNRAPYNEKGIEAMEAYVTINGGKLNYKVPVGRPRTVDQPEPTDSPKQKQQTLF